MTSTYGNNFQLKVFSGRANVPLAERIAQHLGDPLGRLTLQNFPDGEFLARIDEDVRGRDVFVVQPTCAPVNENIMELLIILDSLKRASAARITVVLPYYGYARQDRKDVGRVPITAKLIADLLTTAGASRVMALDLHAAQIQGFFNVPVDHLHAAPVISRYVRTLGIAPDDLVVLSPDEGSIKRAIRYQNKLGGGLAIIDKRRVSSAETRQVNVIGASLEGKVAVLFDDMVSTAGSMVGAAHIARQNGARAIYACATHGVLCDGAIEKLRDAPLTELVISDSIPLTPEKQLAKIKVLGIGELLADAIKRIHFNESVSKLFD
jgi:ribose-phosphate pyrophosphokinase